jgi:hypothetical protein
MRFWQDGTLSLGNLAPASQPTPPLVRYPGGVGLKIHAVFYFCAPHAGPKPLWLENRFELIAPAAIGTYTSRVEV